MVRTLVRETLVREGYRILDTSDPTEARRIADHHKGPIQLLITDVVMPKVNGRDLAEQLVRRRHDMKVLYMSGYTDNAVLNSGILHKDVAFLQKPFTPGILTEKVREVLEADGRTRGRRRVTSIPRNQSRSGRHADGCGSPSAASPGSRSPAGPAASRAIVGSSRSTTVAHLWSQYAGSPRIDPPVVQEQEHYRRGPALLRPARPQTPTAFAGSPVPSPELRRRICGRAARKATCRASSISRPGRELRTAARGSPESTPVSSWFPASEPIHWSAHAFHKGVRSRSQGKQKHVGQAGGIADPRSGSGAGCRARSCCGLEQGGGHTAIIAP